MSGFAVIAGGLAGVGLLGALGWLLMTRTRLSLPQVITGAVTFGLLLTVFRWYVLTQAFETYHPEELKRARAAMEPGFIIMSFCLAGMLALGMFLGSQQAALLSPRQKASHWFLFLAGLIAPPAFPAVALIVSKRLWAEWGLAGRVALATLLGAILVTVVSQLLIFRRSRL
jgi:hypothetical protein